MENESMNEKITLLNKVAYSMRVLSIKMTTKAGSGHVTSALSVADIIAALFFDVMKYDPDNFENPNSDRFILSKGHASPILYAAWRELGKLTDQDILSYRSFNSVLEGHPTFAFPYTEAATGSLGVGLSIGVGEALVAKLDRRDFKTFVLMGDSEVSEGSVWEAVQLAAYYKLNNLIGIIDCNRLGQSTATMEALEGGAPVRFKNMFNAFGFDTQIVNGHDMQELVSVLSRARDNKSDKPMMIIAKTKKGYGVDIFEDKEGFHGKALNEDQEAQALKQLKKRFVRYDEPNKNIEIKSTIKAEAAIQNKKITLLDPDYKTGEKIPTRKAYGEALVAIGGVDKSVVCLDAEVKNSTYAELFEQAYPNRFYQCFIAEQNMVSMAVGMDRRGKLPFVSTFGCFFSRAHDQLRMAAIGQAALRCCGSHAGVSIGQDGPSQMALEDIALFRGLPDSIVFYPSDAVSTHKLVGLMANYHDGISYLRTTRGATPVIYSNNESFEIGGCKVLKQSKKDAVLVVAAGITLFEALKAHELLAKEGIAIALIDLYCIKPLDLKTIVAVANNANNLIITVEDHYLEGGIGEAVAAAVSTYGIELYRLGVNHLPRSGSPEELIAHYGIDALSIANKVRDIG